MSRGMPGVLRSTVLAAAFAAVLLPSNSVRADIDLVWWTIESENFIIHYHEPLGDVARRSASLAERAHATLVSSMKSLPSERTHLIVRDQTDSSNGFAQTIPRNSVTIFVTAPDGNSQLMDHDDWLYGLIVHEYAHIVHLDDIGGLPKLVNRVVGKTWSPNQVQPRWMIEGIATYQESKRSSSGRNRFAEFAADLRLNSLTGRPQRMDEISSGSRRWPHGTTSYEYGGAFLKYVFDTYGDDIAGAISTMYGSNPIPWSLNRTFAEHTGKPMTELYDEFIDSVRGEAAHTLEAVERAGRREGQRLTFTGETHLFPRFRRDRDNSIVWLRSDGLNDNILVEIPADRPGATPTPYMETGRINRFALAPDGSAVVSQTQVYEAEYGFRDLVHFEPKTRKYTLLTERLRAANPAISPDGKMVAFVVNDAGNRSLAISPIEPGAERRTLWRGERYDQAFEPAFSPDGKTIAFSTWRQGGFRDIAIVDTATGQISELARDRAQDVNPTFDPLGRYLFFASDRTGVFNIYARELGENGRLWQVTNVVGGANQPDVSNDGKTLVYQGIVSGGFSLYTIKLDPSSFTLAAAYINDRPDPPIVHDDEAAITAPRRYRPLETLAPQSIEFQLSINSFGQALSALTGGADVLGRHRYTLTSTLSLEDRNVNVAARYTYDRLWPLLSAAVGRRAFRRGGLILDGRNTRFTEEELSASVGATLPIFSLPRVSGTMVLDYNIRRVRNLDERFGDFDPNDEVPDFPETDATLAGVGVRWAVRSARGFAHTLGATKGAAIALSATLDHPIFGSDFSTLRVRYDGAMFGEVPQLPGTSLYWRASGGLGLSDRRSRPSFTLGGVPEQEIIDSVINTIRRSSTGYLRGFDSGTTSGAHFHLMNFEVRRELLTIERGISSMPIYFRRLHAAALFDIGNTWRDEVDLTDIRMGVGGSLRLDAVFGYFVPGQFDIGYARGIGDDGKNEVWFLLATTI